MSELGLGTPECAVCLQACIHPVRLPCNHVFCFLCVKGAATQNKLCPMCRHEIPPDYLEHPQLLEELESHSEGQKEESSQEEYRWFYEGRNGWWQYDERTSLELETAFKQGKAHCELLIAGYIYVADFALMLQVRRDNHSRKRKIKRDVYNAPKKGIAGLRLNSEAEDQNSRDADQSTNSNQATNTTDTSTSQSPNSDDTTTRPQFYFWTL